MSIVTEESVVLQNASTVNVITHEALERLLAAAEERGYHRSKEEEEVIDRKELSRILKINPATLKRWIETGEIPPPRTVGQNVYWVKSSIIDFIKAK